MPARRNSRRIRGAYSQADLSSVLTLPETEFADVFGMQTTEVDQRGWGSRVDDYYHFRDNGSHVLAVAHLDTVVRPNRRKADFYATNNGPAVISGALDDRLGAYVILKMLPALGVTCDWLLTVGEENGESTAGFFKPAKEYDWVIEFDRGGTDVVMYQYEDEPTRQAVRACGATVGKGSFSDICYLEDLNVKAFNWGVGYQGNYHSEKGYAVLGDTFSMVGKYLRFHRQNIGVTMPHESDEPSHDGLDCDMCGEWDSVNLITMICGSCHRCYECGKDEYSCGCYATINAQSAADDAAYETRKTQENAPQTSRLLRYTGDAGCMRGDRHCGHSRHHRRTRVNPTKERSNPTMMFLVRMDLKLPEVSGMREANLYREEAEAAKPYLDSGEFSRVWRVPGTRNHVALWDVKDAQTIHDAYTSFPMFPWMTVTVEPLCVNPNDPGEPASDLPDLPMTWASLNQYYREHRSEQHVSAIGEGGSVDLTPDVSIHTHPTSQFPAEIHFMVGGQKVCELGPDVNLNNEPKAPGYIDFLSEWEGIPVLHRRWKARIQADNGLLHPDYAAALAAPRARF
jgi:muconolactone D-isomerase